MTSVQVGDTITAVLPFLAVILIELISVLGSYLPLEDWNLSIPEWAKDWIHDYSTEKRELLDPDTLQQVLEEELNSRYDVSDDQLESEARGIAVAIQKKVPQHQTTLLRLVEETTALAYDAGRVYFSMFITGVSLIPVLYTRIVNFSLAPVPVGVILLIPVFLYATHRINWFRNNVDSINSYAGLRAEGRFSPISRTIIVTNGVAIFSILVVDGCAGPLGIPFVPLNGACGVFYPS